MLLLLELLKEQEDGLLKEWIACSGLITKLTITLERACHIIPKHVNEQKLVSSTYERHYNQLIISLLQLLMSILPSPSRQ